MKSPTAKLLSPKGYTVDGFLNNVPIGRTSLYKLIKEGKLRSVIISGRRIIPATEADRLLEPVEICLVLQPTETKIA